MSDRIQFSEHARITEKVLNDAFTYMEEADHRLVSDLGIQGIAHGLGVRPQYPVADLTVVVTGPGLAYDAQGRRIHIRMSQTINCARSSDNMPTAVVAPGHERWVSIGLAFDRDMSDAVRDQYNRPVYTRQRESFRIVVLAGEEAPGGHAERPALSQDVVHLCDLRLTHDHERVQASDLDTSRRKDLRLWQARHIATQGRWRSLPSNDSLDGVLDGLDNVLAETRQTANDGLQSLDARITSLASIVAEQARRRFPLGRRVCERIVVSRTLSLPAVAAGGVWTMAVRIPGLRPDDHRVVAVHACDPEVGRRFSISAIGLMRDSVRLVFRNPTQQVVDSSSSVFELDVSVLEAAVPQLETPRAGE